MDPVVWAVAAFAGLIAAFGLIGADALWLVPLGDELVHGHLPGSVPYATAATHGWHDVPAAAEVLFWAFFHALGGDRGLAALQAVAAAVAFGALAHGLRRHASGRATLVLSMLVLVGSLSAVVVTGFSLFSLALLPVLLNLLESETRAPSSRIWLGVPLLALWGNLHGSVLVGWALLACYLVFERGRREPRLAAAVLGAGTAALFANPELWHTPFYYRAVFLNETARQGVGLWAPLNGSALDVLLATTVVSLLAIGLLRGVRFRLWEGVACLALAVSTIHVARTGVWLLFLAAYPAGRSLVGPGLRARPLAVVAAALGVAALTVLVQGPDDPGSRSMAMLAARSGRPVLAEAILGQQVALAGGRVWVDNPIDAFRKSDQRLYLAWLLGRQSGAAAITHAALVLVVPWSPAGRLASRDPRLERLAVNSRAALYRVRSAYAH